jgi:hypothetical protein
MLPRCTGGRGALGPLHRINPQQEPESSPSEFYPIPDCLSPREGLDSESRKWLLRTSFLIREVRWPFDVAALLVYPSRLRPLSFWSNMRLTSAFIFLAIAACTTPALSLPASGSQELATRDSVHPRDNLFTVTKRQNETDVEQPDDTVDEPDDMKSRRTHHRL